MPMSMSSQLARCHRHRSNGQCSHSSLPSYECCLQTLTGTEISDSTWDVGDVEGYDAHMSSYWMDACSLEAAKVEWFATESDNQHALGISYDAVAVNDCK